MPGQSFGGFAERVALVTHGGRGMGRAVALQLALEGAYVIVNPAPGDAESASVAAELRELGTLALTVEGDVSRAGDVRHVFAEIESAFGRLDLLVNAASFRGDEGLDELTEEAWDVALSVNLKSAFLCAQAGARLMRARPKPAIVNVASAYAMTGRAGNAAFVAAQAGLVGLTKTLARELSPRIRVNCVAVSGAETEPAPAPDEVARACVYLLSAAAGAITGQTLVVAAQGIVSP